MYNLVLNNSEFSEDEMTVTYDITNYRSSNKFESKPLLSINDPTYYMFHGFGVICWPSGRNKKDNQYLILCIMLKNCANVSYDVEVIYDITTNCTNNILSENKRVTMIQVLKTGNNSNYTSTNTSNLSIIIRCKILDLFPSKPLFNNQLLRELQNLMEDEDSCDVNIVVNKINIPVHKCILSARSPVLKAMLNSTMKEGLQKEMHIDDISEAAIREMIFYLYTGTTPNLKEIAGELVIAADKYCLNLLKESCESMLLKNLDIQNACSSFFLADLYNLKKLKSACLFLICNNLYKVLNSDVFNELIFPKPNLMRDLLSESASFIGIANNLKI